MTLHGGIILGSTVKTLFHSGRHSSKLFGVPSSYRTMTANLVPMNSFVPITRQNTKVVFKYLITFFFFCFSSSWITSTRENTILKGFTIKKIVQWGRLTKPKWLEMNLVQIWPDVNNLNGNHSCELHWLMDFDVVKSAEYVMTHRRTHQRE